MSNCPWIDAYQPREWVVMTIVKDTKKYDALMEASSLITHDDLPVIYAAESGAARKHWQRKDTRPVFYFDFEQLLGMGLKKPYGFELRILNREWQGHAAEKYILLTYKGVTDDPVRFTLGIEK